MKGSSYSVIITLAKVLKNVLFVMISNLLLLPSLLSLINDYALLF
jgi:hypothetical protein